MNKVLILSVRPEHAINILNGNKTLELRKSVPKEFKGWVYVYVTKGKPFLNHWYGKYYLVDDYTYEELVRDYSIPLNGTIPFRFWFDEYTKLKYERWGNHEFFDWNYRGLYDVNLKTFDKLCLTESQVNDYGKGKDLYAWHIKQLDIFDKPMKLGEFYKTDSKYMQDYERLVLDYNNKIIKSESKLKKLPITKAPQSYMYAWVKEELK